MPILTKKEFKDPIPETKKESREETSRPILETKTFILCHPDRGTALPQEYRVGEKVLVMNDGIIEANEQEKDILISQGFIFLHEKEKENDR